MKSRKIRNNRQAAMLEPIRYSIDFVTAILLLMGQITTSGIFVVPDGFYLAATGEILGGVRLTGHTPGTAQTTGMELRDFLRREALKFDN